MPWICLLLFLFYCCCSCNFVRGLFLLLYLVLLLFLTLMLLFLMLVAFCCSKRCCCRWGWWWWLWSCERTCWKSYNIMASPSRPGVMSGIVGWVVESIMKVVCTTGGVVNGLDRFNVFVSCDTSEISGSSVVVVSVVCAQATENNVCKTCTAKGLGWIRNDRSNGNENETSIDRSIYGIYCMCSVSIV